MHQQHLKITLLTKLVASARSGSSGGHECLEYLPGSLLFGLCARLWKKDPQTPLPAELFFSGSLRFTDGLPEGKPGVPAVPAVFSLHQPKKPETDQANDLRNHSAGGPPESKEKQIVPVISLSIPPIPAV